MTAKAMIAGLSGLTLNDSERAFFNSENPWGFILFARNVDTPGQVTDLCASLRECVGRPDAPILVDQEGGRVQRLRAPHWEKYPAGASLGGIFQIDPEKGKRAAWLLSRLHAFDLLRLGITVDCLPVLDVPQPGGHDVIGDRALGATPDQVSALGLPACEGLMAGGVMPVIKHIPGHGRAMADSHKELPVVTTPRDELEATDFPPFAALSSMPMAMTAHVVYTALDADNPATTSPKIIDEVIRAQMGFDGLLMSDDVSMEALSGDFADRTRAIFAAGCDIVLHCNGEMAQTQAVASSTPVLADKALERATRALQGIGETDTSNEAACRAEFAELMNMLPMA